MKTLKRPPSLFKNANPVPLIILLTTVFALSTSATFGSDAPPAKTSAKGEKTKASAKLTGPIAKKASSEASAPAKKVTLTGSRIPREVKSTGNVRETPSPVYVVDRKEIERSGAMTTAQLLRRLPFVR